MLLIPRFQLLWILSFEEYAADSHYSLHLVSGYFVIRKMIVRAKKNFANVGRAGSSFEDTKAHRGGQMQYDEDTTSKENNSRGHSMSYGAGGKGLLRAVAINSFRPASES